MGEFMIWIHGIILGVCLGISIGISIGINQHKNLDAKHNVEYYHAKIQYFYPMYFTTLSKVLLTVTFQMMARKENND